jgi:molecular chaperone GrpE
LHDEKPPDEPDGPEEGPSTESESSREAAPREASGLADALEVPSSDEAEAYHRRARLAEDRLAEVMDAYRTLRKDNEGFKERVAKNTERRFDQRRERLLLKFIDILDNMDRALDAAEQTYAGEPLIEGLILVRTQLLQTLQEEGLERIPVLGLPFDPNVAEAVETRPVDDPDQDHLVVKELMRGYRLNGRIARPSRVVVGQYAGEGSAAAAQPSGDAVSGPGAPDSQGVVDSEPTLDEIISKAEAQEALFPDAFDAEDDSE